MCCVCPFFAACLTRLAASALAGVDFLRILDIMHGSWDPGEVTLPCIVS